MVVVCLDYLKQGKATEQEISQAITLGWCVEWVSVCKVNLGYIICECPKGFVTFNSHYFMTNSYRPSVEKFDWFKAGL